jgi:hypothetical protein
MKRIIFNIGDTVKHIYTGKVLEISAMGTGNGQVSIGCVEATKSEREIVKKK